MSALAVDLDGTLVDTGRANVAAYDAALRAHGVVLRPEALTPLSGGRHWSDVLPAMLADHPGVDPAAVARAKRACYHEHLDVVAVNMPLAGLLTQLRAPLALVTTASRASAGAVLRHVGLLDLFTALVTGDDVTHHKPHPEPYERAARLLGVPVASLVALEDSDTGAASARAAGAQVWRVQWPDAAAAQRPAP